MTIITAPTSKRRRTIRPDGQWPVTSRACQSVEEHLNAVLNVAPGLIPGASAFARIAFNGPIVPHSWGFPAIAG